MFFYLSKTLYYVAMPLFWVFVFLLISLFSKKPGKKKITLIIAISLLWIFTNNFLANRLIDWWEANPVPVSEINNYNVAIVLTGVTIQNPKATDRVNYSKGADRVLHTIQLYKMGKIKKIMITGGKLFESDKGIPEALQIKQTLLLAGIPESDIYTEQMARNTRENAVLTKQKLDSLKLQPPYLLVTSAFHMKRSFGCFRKAGLKVTPFPTDFYVGEIKYTPAELLIPNEGAMNKFGILIHELIGFTVYKIIGYC